MSSEEIDPKSIDFSQYIPKWKDESSEEDEDAEKSNESDWYFKDGFEKVLDPDVFIDNKNEVRWRHVIKAAELLKERHNNYTGPYTHQQVSEIVFEVMLKEALDDLVKKQMLKQNDNGTYQLTKNGIEEVEKLKQRTVNENKKGNDLKD